MFLGSSFLISLNLSLIKDSCLFKRRQPKQSRACDRVNVAMEITEWSLFPTVPTDHKGGRRIKEGGEQRGGFIWLDSFSPLTFAISNKRHNPNSFSQVRNQSSILEFSFTTSVPSLNQEPSSIALISKYLSCPVTHPFHWCYPNPGPNDLFHGLLQGPFG